MQIKWTSAGQFKIMPSAPKYIAERSVWWEECMDIGHMDTPIRLYFYSTSIRRPFDCLSKVIKVTVT